MSSYHLIIADKLYPIDWPTVNFRDAGRLDATAPTGAPTAPAKGMGGDKPRFRKRHVDDRSLSQAQAIIRQFVVHLDGCMSAKQCFDVLHHERGLSCHFILDNDGTLYQTLDLIDCAYHAAGLNETSLGIEICNRGDAKKDPGRYDNAPRDLRRDVVSCTINDSLYVAYDFTTAQYEAMQALGHALARYLPGIRLDFPQSSPGVQSWSTLHSGDDMAAGKLIQASYAGYLGHYHITRRKWDPGPFDFRRFLGKLSGRRSFPIGLASLARKVEVPEAPPLSAGAERVAYERVFDAYYDNNELEGAGGFFPVGPLDDHQLYHGGIHLHGKAGDNVVVPVKGKVVLERNGPADPNIGSTNFVLIEHSELVGGERLDFWTLFYHLAEEPRDGERTGVRVVDPGRAVQAGDVVGHVGLAGPDGGEPQLHWEIFTVDHGPVQRLDSPGFWKLISAGSDQRYCTNKEILRKIEKRRDGILTRQELFDHFRGDPEAREWTHHVVTFHYSEWSETPDWKEALLDPPDPKKRGRRPAEVEKLYEDQILPAIWWRDDVARRLKLPTEARVYTYHPVSFLRFFNDLVGTKQADAVRLATNEDKARAKSGMVDIDDTDGTHFVTEAETSYVPVPQRMPLQDLIDGYGD